MSGFSPVRPRLTSCDTTSYRRFLTTGDPRRWSTESAKAKIWVGYLEYALEHHADNLPNPLQVGASYVTNYTLSWDQKDSGVASFHIATHCTQGQLKTVVNLGHKGSSARKGRGAGRVVGNPPRR